MANQNIFTNEILDYLISEKGTLALKLAGELDFSKVSDVAKLRKICTAEQARAVIELSELRQRAKDKFRLAEQMFFDRIGYEQASGEDVAEYKAKRIRDKIGGYEVADLCCGIGGDTIALADKGNVIACDFSSVRIRMAELNLSVYGRAERCRFACCDVNDLNLDGIKAFHIDPDRRSERKRVVSIEKIRPGVEFIDKLLKIIPDGAIKLSPACDYNQLPWKGEIELVSVYGRCKQLIVWTGQFAQANKRARSLTSGETISDDVPVRYNVGQMGTYLYDPDASCSRLNLLGQAAYLGNLDFLSPGQIVLSSDALVKVPLMRAYKVIDVMPYREDKLLKYFRSNRARVTVKPRGVDVNVDRLSKRLSFGEDERYLFLLRLDKKIIAVITERIG